MKHQTCIRYRSLLIFFFPNFFKFIFCYFIFATENHINQRLLPIIKKKLHGDDSYVTKDSLLAGMVEINEWNIEQNHTLHWLHDYGEFEISPDRWYPLTEFMTLKGDVQTIVGGYEYRFCIPRDSRKKPILEKRDKIGYVNGIFFSSSMKIRDPRVVGEWKPVKKFVSNKIIFPTVPVGATAKKNLSVSQALLFQFCARPASIKSVIDKYNKKVADALQNGMNITQLKLNLEHLGQEGLTHNYNHHPNRTWVCASGFNSKLRYCWVLNSV